MRNLWRGTGALAFVLVATAACTTTPQYPISQAAAPAPPPAAAPAPAAPAARADEGDPTRFRAPLPQVESHALPPPAAAAGAMTSPASATTANDVPPPTDAAPPAAAPGPTASADGSMLPRAAYHEAPAVPSRPAPPPPAAPAPPPANAYAPPPRTPSYAAPRRQTVEQVSIGGDVVSASGIFQEYEVQRGDHVDALARGFHTTRQVILDANDDLRAPYRLRPGQILKVPVAKAYVVERGDTLAGIARRFNVAPDELAQLNHISSRAGLRTGQKIGLPASMRDSGPIRTRVTTTQYVEAAPPPSPPPQRATGYTPTSRPPAYAAAPPQPSAGLETPLPVTRSPSAPPPPSAPPSTPSYATPSRPPAPPPAQSAAPPLNSAEIMAAARGKFVWPVRGDVLSGFGPRAVGQRNDGIDIKAAQGTSVRASAAGQVVYAGNEVPGYGNLVLVLHADGWVTAYGHLDRFTVHIRDQIAQGQEIGLVGMSGDASQPMLHFEVRYAPAPGAKTRPIDPVLALPSS